MNRIAAAGLSVFLVAGIAACNGGGSNTSNSALNLAGTWTISTASTQGHGSTSGTATVTQSGQGLGVNGSTTLAAPPGQIAVSQSGTALTGTIANSLAKTTFNFTGTLSNGNFTVTGSVACSSKANASTSVTGAITSSSMQGTYTITRDSGCYYPSDAGTFVATKK